MPGPPPKPTHLRLIEGKRNRRPGTKEAAPKMSCANAELNAKCSSPPATRNRGLIATCSTAIPAPMTKSEATAIE